MQFFILLFFRWHRKEWLVNYTTLMRKGKNSFKWLKGSFRCASAIISKKNGQIRGKFLMAILLGFSTSYLETRSLESFIILEALVIIHRSWALATEVP